jgi:hypothetical protein
MKKSPLASSAWANRSSLSVAKRIPLQINGDWLRMARPWFEWTSANFISSLIVVSVNRRPAHF